MAKIPAMTATVNENTTRREITVVVEHDPRQSYSRAVKPRAVKAFKDWTYRNIMFGAPSLRDVFYDSPLTHDGRALTVYFFTY